jgi:hypothetical protein
VTLREAARIVGMPVTTLRTSYLGTRAAAAGRRVARRPIRCTRGAAVKDARGAWWFRPEQLEAIVRARWCEEAGELSLPGAEPPGPPRLG